VAISHEPKKRRRKYFMFSDQEKKFYISRIFPGRGGREGGTVQEALIIFYTDCQSAPQREPSDDPKMLFKLKMLRNDL